MTESRQLVYLTTGVCLVAGAAGFTVLGWPAVLGAGLVGAMLYGMAALFWWMDRP